MAGGQDNKFCFVSKQGVAAPLPPTSASVCQSGGQLPHGALLTPDPDRAPRSSRQQVGGEQVRAAACPSHEAWGPPPSGPSPSCCPALEASMLGWTTLASPFGAGAQCLQVDCALPVAGGGRARPSQHGGRATVGSLRLEPAEITEPGLEWRPRPGLRKPNLPSFRWPVALEGGVGCTPLDLRESPPPRPRHGTLFGNGLYREDRL